MSSGNNKLTNVISPYLTADHNKSIDKICCRLEISA